MALSSVLWMGTFPPEAPDLLSPTLTPFNIRITAARPAQLHSLQQFWKTASLMEQICFILSSIFTLKEIVAVNVWDGQL